MQIATNELQKEMKTHGNFSYPLLISREKLSLYESGSFLWHWHPEIELTLITKGQMLYKINHDSFLLREGHALFGNSSTLHSGYMVENRDCEYISITFEPKFIYGYENSNIYTKYIKPIVQNYFLPAIPFDGSASWHDEMIRIIKKIIEIETAKYATYELDILSQLTQFWKLLFLNNPASSTGIPSDKNNYDRIREIISYVETHYTASITLEEIAQSVHLCRSECSRLFKRYMHISLFEFISQYRIEKSLDYLMNTSCSILEIANLVGYDDSNYYAKVFRKTKGCSPSQYRSGSLSRINS